MTSRIRSLLRPIAALTIASGVALGAAPVQAASTAPRAPSAAGADAAVRHERAFLQLRLDAPENRAAYVGEALAGVLEVFVRADTGATVRGAPRLDTPDVVVLEPPGDIAQRDEVVGGVAYRVASFDVVVSPAVAGDLTLRATLPVDLTWHDLVRRKVEAPRPRLFDRMLADDFFAHDPLLREMLAELEGSAFEELEQTVAVERSETVELAIAPATLRVKALPTKGQPAGFGGAVGRFTIGSEVAPATVREGEPTTLTVTVAGEGNFDRLAWDGVAATPQLTVYDPEAKTTGDGEARRRVFQQTIVPRSSGVDAIPAAAITYFDPDEGRYVTATADPLPIEVLPAPPGAAAPRAGAPGSEGAVEDATVFATLRPPYLDRRFWAWQLAPLGAALSLAGAAAARSRRDATATARARRERARRSLAAMRHAAAGADAHAWLAAAFAALQGAVADAPEQAAALSPAEVAARLGDRGAALAPLLEAVDAERYGGRPPADLDIANLHALVQKEITS
jgi:hypothetical protein